MLDFLRKLIFCWILDHHQKQYNLENDDITCAICGREWYPFNT